MSADFFIQYPYLCDTFFISRKTKVVLDEVDAGELISPYRMDLMAKLLWILACHGAYDRQEAERIYEDHLLAFSHHRMREWGQQEKCGIEQYRDTFQSICTAVRETKSSRIQVGYPIPVDGKQMAMDGAHRISAAIYYHKRVPIYRVSKVIPNKYDYHFFRKRYMEEGYLLRMVEKYVTLRTCRLYMFRNRELNKILGTQIDRECAPVYVKKIRAGETWILLDEEWLERNGKVRQAEKLLGNRFLRGTEVILQTINERRSDLLMQGCGYTCRKKIGVFCGRHWDGVKILVKRLLGRPV